MFESTVERGPFILRDELVRKPDRCQLDAVEFTLTQRIGCGVCFQLC